MGIFEHKKKLAVLFCSPHGQGHTRRLTDSFLACFREDKSWEIEEIDVYEAGVKPCIACGACGKKEGCALSSGDGADGFQKIDKAFRQSDLLVIASPVYNCSFPAPMKAVLDRTQQYFEARFSLGKKPPVKKHRNAVLLLTMGSKEEFAVEVTAHQLERAFSVMNTTLAGCAVWEGTDLGDEGRGEAVRKAGELAEEQLRAGQNA